MLDDWPSHLARFFRVAPRATAATIEGANEGHSAEMPAVPAAR